MQGCRTGTIFLGTHTAHTTTRGPRTMMCTRTHTVPQRRHTVRLTPDRTEAPRLE